MGDEGQIPTPSKSSVEGNSQLKLFQVWGVCQFHHLIWAELVMLPQTVHKLSYNYWLVGSSGCLFSSTYGPLVMIAVAVDLQERPPTVPESNHWTPDCRLVGNPSFTKAITAVPSLVFAYAGAPGYPN